MTVIEQLAYRVRQCGGDPREVAAALEPFLARTDLLTEEQMEPDPTTYRQHILYVEPDDSFSIVAIVWLPEQVTCIHDHVSWCVVGTYRGAEEETRFELTATGDGLVQVGQESNPAGTVAYLTPPGDIHLVRNSTGGTAVSIHIYGANIAVLGNSVRRRYDLPVLDSVPA